MDNLHQHQRIFENADLIVKHLKGKLTPHEQEMLNDWLEEDKRNRQFLETLSDESAFRKELQFLSSVDVSSAWEKVSRYTSQQRKIKLWEYIIKWKYAAMLSFFITVACMFYIRFDNETKPFVARQSDQNYTNDVLPGGDKALLELSDGTVLILEQVDNGSLQQQGETHLVKQDGQLVYNAAQRNQSEEIFYNKISTPKGGQYQVILPDGSKVWLNAGSSLRFPTAFTGKERQVELTGEAYFEIAKITTLSSSGRDKQRMPFKVKTDKANVEVLGTHFNVMAYAEEGSVNTTLLEGSVK
ncbi:MAG TPA: FecR family protein, partial [Sphingobacteriaceae bacterium]